MRLVFEIRHYTPCAFCRDYSTPVGMCALHSTSSANRKPLIVNLQFRGDRARDTAKASGELCKNLSPFLCGHCRRRRRRRRRRSARFHWITNGDHHHRAESSGNLRAGERAERKQRLQCRAYRYTPLFSCATATFSSPSGKSSMIYKRRHAKASFLYYICARLSSPIASTCTGRSLAIGKLSVPMIYLAAVHFFFLFTEALLILGCSAVDLCAEIFIWGISILQVRRAGLIEGRGRVLGYRNALSRGTWR